MDETSYHFQCSKQLISDFASWGFGIVKNVKNQHRCLQGNVPTACLKPVCAVFKHLRRVAVKRTRVFRRSSLSCQTFFVSCKCFGQCRRVRKTFSSEPKIVFKLCTITIVICHENKYYSKGSLREKILLGFQVMQSVGPYVKVRKKWFLLGKRMSPKCLVAVVGFGNARLARLISGHRDRRFRMWGGVHQLISSMFCISVLSAPILVCLRILKTKLSIFVAWRC